jgi:hypothetical protein
MILQDAGRGLTAGKSAGRQDPVQREPVVSGRFTFSTPATQMPVHPERQELAMPTEDELADLDGFLNTYACS